jgi:hypothetical protein
MFDRKQKGVTNLFKGEGDYNATASLHIAVAVRLLLVCLEVLLEKPTLAAHWLACVGSVKMMMMMMINAQPPSTIVHTSMELQSQR